MVIGGIGSAGWTISCGAARSTGRQATEGLLVAFHEMRDPPASDDVTQRAPWWQTSVIYQIYPRSFQDSNGDGVGDLRGIVQRLPHLVELGVDALWLSPIFASPMADFGYDISDYTGIDPLFGTLADFDALRAPAHGHGLRVIL